MAAALRKRKRRPVTVLLQKVQAAGQPREASRPEGGTVFVAPYQRGSKRSSASSGEASASRSRRKPRGGISPPLNASERTESRSRPPSSASHSSASVSSPSPETENAKPCASVSRPCPGRL